MDRSHNNAENAKELNVIPVLDKMQYCRKNWILHILVHTMPRNGLLGIIRNYKPKGQSNQVRLPKKLQDVQDRNGSKSGAIL